MKRVISIFCVLTVCLILIASIIPVQASATSITLLNPPAGGELHLGIGQSYTFDIAVNSDTQFIQAIALIDQYFPERGVRDQGADVIVRQTSGVLHMTVKGVSSTAKLPNSISPITLFVGVRYGGGQVVQQAFPINVIVS
jgi:hypothetical protein